jgi:hypothetical protein
VSPVYWGTEVREERDAALGAPFNVGGWRVVPHPGDPWRAGRSLELFGAVLGPPEDAGGPVVEVAMTLSKDGREIRRMPAETVPLSRVRGDFWMHGRSIALNDLPGPGSYELAVTVREPRSGTTRTSLIPLHLR